MISPVEELKNNKNYKWHHSYACATVNYLVFKNTIQRTLKEENFKLAEKGMTDMIVDTDHFLTMCINMASTSAMSKGSTILRGYKKTRWQQKKA